MAVRDRSAPCSRCSSCWSTPCWPARAAVGLPRLGGAGRAGRRRARRRPRSTGLLAVVLAIDAALLAAAARREPDHPAPARRGRRSRSRRATPRLSARPRASCGRCRPRRRAARCSSAAPPICSRTSASSASRSPGATSNTSSSCTWSSIRERRPAALDRPVDVEHRDLDQVGGRALDRRVERHPLGHLAALPVVAGQVGQVAAPAQDRLGVAGAAGLVDDAGEVVADPAERLEVLVHQPPRLGRARSELLAEPERRQAVGEAVVHRLDLGPHLDGRRRRAATSKTRAAVIEWKSRPGPERLDQQRRPRRGAP